MRLNSFCECKVVSIIDIAVPTCISESETVTLLINSVLEEESVAVQRVRATDDFPAAAGHTRGGWSNQERPRRTDLC